MSKILQKKEDRKIFQTKETPRESFLDFPTGAGDGANRIIDFIIV